MAEFQAGKFCSDLDDIYGRTAKLTGVSVSTVRRIVDEGFKNESKLVTHGKHRQGRPKKQIDDFDLCAIRQKAPTNASTVNKIKLWLLENNIPFDESLRKPYLLMLVKKHKPELVYHIDGLLGDHGHTVIRLPLYHCDLNPIELVWAMVKKRIAQKNVGGQNVAKLAEEAFQSVTPQEWKNCVEHVKSIEKEYFTRGRTLYNEIDRLFVSVCDDSSSDSEEVEVD
ncbi:unnamed protein product [Arctia plantaginis]|uniref:Tc1-like transposase DDE domain-containing protein n=1 Tax=Arctia plantaginis TaxID=874455 RepID=A0A8S1A665_ARCPL|nr:unnamed protein product [Arctia plantaginis]